VTDSGSQVAAVWESPSEERTRELGAALGRVLQPGDVVGLVGELGSGKTTLVQGIARGAGARGYVASPTFTLVREYEGRLRLYHVDLFRLQPEDLEGIGFDDLLEADGAVLVEWADRAAGHLPADTLWVEVVGTGAEVRTFRVRPAGERARGLVERWRAEVEAVGARPGR
jgi:tRNA threonylcarbamoyladenosine biosynthesis protein TsaE